MENSDKSPKTIHDKLDIKDCPYVPGYKRNNMRIKPSIQLSFGQIQNTWINLLSSSQWSTYFYQGLLVTVAAPMPHGTIKIPLLLLIHWKEAYAYIYMLKSRFGQLPSEIKNRLHVKDLTKNGSIDKAQSSKEPQKEVASAIRGPKPMVWGAYRSQILSLLNGCIVATSLSLDGNQKIDCFFCTKKDGTGHTRYYIPVEIYDKLAVSVKELMNYQGEDKFLDSLQITSTHPMGMQLRAGKKLWVISKKGLDQLFLNNKVKIVDVDFDDGTDQVIIRFYQSAANKKLYILPEDLEEIPDKIRKQLNIHYCQPMHTDTKSRENEGKPRKSGENSEETVPNSRKIVINDDSIIPQCKSVSIHIGDECYRVIGYLSKATGSLLVPASVFIKNVPTDLWHRLNLSDPKKLLPLQGSQGSPYEIGNGDLQDCSILFKYGYSVRKSVSFDTRRNALNAALADRAVTKEQAIRLISRCIALNKARYHDACARWRGDLEYLNQLPDSNS